MHTILFTGGGTAGHVTPNIALIKRFQSEGWKTVYVGSTEGIEKDIISHLKIPYYGISAGKLRRYFSWENFLTPFQVMHGIIQAFNLCRRLKPNIVFSKGGFVAFPIVLAAWLNRIPVAIHESDFTPGLANRLSFPFAKEVFVTFPEVHANFNSGKWRVTGTPVRESLLQGSRERGLLLCHFDNQKPIILVSGGGLGSTLINQTIQSILPTLLEKYQIIHLCGKNKINPKLINLKGYKQFEYLNEEFPDVMACAELVISRAGANSLYELLVLKKPHILIPLSKKASRGDQIDNARYFATQGISIVIPEEELDKEKLLNHINRAYHEKDKLKQKIASFSLPDSIELIYTRLTQLALNKS